MAAPQDPPSPPVRIPDLEADATVVVSDSRSGAGPGAGAPPAGLAATTLPPPTARATGPQPGLSAGATSPGPAPGSLAGRLREGDLLAEDRYRILRFLGEGGMGSVYEALDLELGISLALKTLRAETTAPLALERFKREIHVARQVSHPNVCRLYDLGRHRSPDGQDLVFLTMQLLDGETLRERIARAGAFSPAEAWPLVRDMAAALDAAHQAGIVHRDFKSGNVMLVPSREGLRAVVTDFGLAREMVDSGREALTATAGFVGTPTYSSPEQIQGSEVGPASDIYAFGVVLYEMTTGRLPFDDAPTPWIAVVRRLNEMPTAPLVLVPTLPASWNEAILRCLEREPEERFENALEVAESLDPPSSGHNLPPLRSAAPVVSASGGGSRTGGQRSSGGRRGGTTAVQLPVGFGTEAMPAVSRPPPARRARPRELLLISLGALLLLLGLGFALLRDREKPAGPEQPGPAAGAPAGGEARPTIALFGFKNLKQNPEAGWISTAVTEMLAMEVASGDRLRVIPSDQVARLKSELQLAEEVSFSDERLAKVRDNLGSDLVVLGSYLVENGALRLNLRVQNARTYETVSDFQESGKESELIALIEQVGERLRGDLGLAGLTPAEAQAVRAAFPESSAVARIYAEGLAHLHRYELVDATRKLEQAAREAPGNALVQVALSDAYQLAGYEAKADEAARRAAGAAKGLATRYRLWIEAVHYEASRDWQAAIDTFETLWKLYPDDLEVGLRLAKLQVGRTANFDNAMVTFDRLESLPPPAGSDPRIDVMKTFALLRMGQFDRALAVAEAAVVESHKRGAVISEASAYAYIGAAQQNLGNLDQALAAIEKARQLFLRVGYREGASQTLTTTSRVLVARGDLAGARQRLEEAISLQRQNGVTAKLRFSLEALGGLYQTHGELAKAISLYEECLRLSQGFDDQQAFYNKVYAHALFQLGDLDKGRAALAAGEALAQKTQDRILFNEFKKVRAALAYQQGELGAAEKGFRELLEVYRQTGQPNHLAAATLQLAQIDLDRGELGLAAEKIGQANALHSADKYDEVMDRRLLEAALALEQGKLDEARKLLEEQLAVPVAQQIPRCETEALTGLARLELLRAAAARGTAAEGHRQAAAGYARRAADRLGEVESLGRRLRYGIGVERVRGLTGDAGARAAALAALAGLREQAEAKKFALTALEAELASLEIAKAGGDGAAGGKLDALAARAESAGYGALARQARQAAG
jgi:eukaryotic-like serine/threonine-protein kinase